MVRRPDFLLQLLGEFSVVEGQVGQFALEAQPIDFCIWKAGRLGFLPQFVSRPR